MKHIGIIGVSAEGAALCFQTICAEAAQVKGKPDHPEITMHELSSEKYFKAQPNWDAVAELLLVSAQKVAAAGADFAIIPSNTMHFALAKLREKSPIPILSIVDGVIEECVQNGYKKVGIMGTKFTMEGGLYDDALRQAGIEPILPIPYDRGVIDHIIFEEIVPAKVTARTETGLLHIVRSLQMKGAEAVILACTELPIVVTDQKPLPTIDSTRLLAKAALKRAME